ncbi:MAG: hypothetical protein JWQ43_3339 [Glaciihabitans sp.]|nr:hypothetical protein [Glaciihabitans sp.]
MMFADETNPPTDGAADRDMRVVVHRPISGKLRLFVPEHTEMRQWLSDATGVAHPRLWREISSPAHWVVARQYLAEMTYALVERFPEVELVMDYSRIQKCGEGCQNSQKKECTCSCLGRTHGGPSRLNFLDIEQTRPVGSRILRVTRVLRQAELDPASISRGVW